MEEENFSQDSNSGSVAPVSMLLTQWISGRRSSFAEAPSCKKAWDESSRIPEPEIPYRSLKAGNEALDGSRGRSGLERFY